MASLRSLRHYLGIDRPVFYSLLARFWSLIAGPVTILFVGTRLTHTAQGYYYTFASVIGLQVFFELGLNQCIIQFTSHEWARLRIGPDGRLNGEEASLKRVLALGRLSLRWYLALAFLVVVVIGSAGFAFFAFKPDSGIEWRGPWWSMCLAVGMGIPLTSFWTLLEGCNQLPSLYAYRFVAAVVSSAALWGSFAAGYGLYAAAFYSLAAFSVGIIYLRLWWWPLATQILHEPDRHIPALWTSEIWPLQKRIALSWISGYFIFNLFNPICFHFRGAIEAGRLGMSLQAVAALGAIATAWTQTKAPRYGMLISQKRFLELDSLFFRATTQSVAVCAAGSAGLLLLLWGIKNRLSFGERFIDLPDIALLCIATTVFQITSGQAFYLRAHRQEPFMGLSILSGALCAAGFSFACWRWGITGICIAYALIQLLTAILATSIWRASRRAWH